MKADDLKKILASLLLAVTFLGAFHHHKDTGIHHDCPVYIVHSAIISPDIPRENLLAAEIDIDYHIYTSPDTSYATKYIYSGYLGRAPPIFS